MPDTRDEPMLGLATTGDMLHEVATRLELAGDSLHAAMVAGVAFDLTDEQLTYSTVGSPLDATSREEAAEWLRSLADQFHRSEPPREPLPSDPCTCGHNRSEHIYYEGACRPGFFCECGSFEASDTGGGQTDA